MRRAGRVVVVAVLVVVNGVLLVIALSSGLKHSTSPAAVIPSFVPATPSAPRPPRVSVGSKTLQVAPGTPRGLFSAATTLDAWRASGGCSAAADLAATEDQGQTWESLTQPAPHLLAIARTGARTGWAVGANDACQPSEFMTTDGGKTWRAVSHALPAWFPTARGIATPRGSVASPCPVAQSTPVVLAAANALAVVVCGRGVYRTSDGGKTWAPAGPVIRGRAAGAVLAPNGHGALLVSQSPGCNGTRVLRTTDAGRSWSVGGCLVVALPPMLASVGSAGQGFLISVNGSYSTTDDGRSWG